MAINFAAFIEWINPVSAEDFLAPEAPYYVGDVVETYDGVLCKIAAIEESPYYGEYHDRVYVVGFCGEFADWLLFNQIELAYLEG